MNREPLHHLLNAALPKISPFISRRVPVLHLLHFYCGGSPLIMIHRKHSVCVILETNPLCSVSSSYAPITDLHDAPGGSLQVKVDPGLDHLDSVYNHTQDNSDRAIAMERNRYTYLEIIIQLRKSMHIYRKWSAYDYTVPGDIRTLFN